METGAARIALEASTALAAATRIVIRRGLERAALNKTRLKDKAQLAVVRDRRRLIREKLWDGRLPAGRPAMVVGSPGTGGRCAGCEKATSPDQLVMKIPVDDGRTVVDLHAECYQVWEELRATRV